MEVGLRQLWIGDHSQKDLWGDHQNDGPNSIKRTTVRNWEVHIQQCEYKDAEQEEEDPVQPNFVNY